MCSGPTSATMVDGPGSARRIIGSARSLSDRYSVGTPRRVSQPVYSTSYPVAAYPVAQRQLAASTIPYPVGFRGSRVRYGEAIEVVCSDAAGSCPVLRHHPLVFEPPYSLVLGPICVKSPKVHWLAEKAAWVG